MISLSSSDDELYSHVNSSVIFKTFSFAISGCWGTLIPGTFLPVDLLETKLEPMGFETTSMELFM